MEPYRPNCYKIPELNGLRVLLVFIVSWYHFWQQSWLTPSIGSYSLDYLLRAGYMPVDGTILLSGFLLFLPYARAMLLGEAVPNTKQFYQRRIMRIVPSYYFVTLALLFAVALPWHLYYNSSDMVRDVVMHLTFTQTFNPATYIATPIGVASWTIAIEMQAYLIFPLLALVVVLLAVAVYFKEIRRAEEKLSVKRDEIESELPRFVATITQELATSRDVLSMVEHYKQHAGETFSAELDVLTADMRSGSYEAALTRFEARFNSPLLSDIVRGLIGVLRGDNGINYFQMLSHDMKQLELQRLKAKAMKIPPKIRVFSFVLLMCFLVTYLAIIIYEIIHSLGGMF